MQTSTRKILISLHMASPAGRRQLAGIFRYAAKGVNWDFHFGPSTSVLGKEASSLQPTAGYDGIISSIGLRDENFRAIVRRKKIPVVLIDFDNPKSNDIRQIRAGFVSSDDYRAGQDGAKHLLSLGKMRSYGFMPANNPTSRWSILRQQGMADVLVQHGMELDVFDSSTNSLEKWLMALPKPTAVMAAADAGATQAIIICHNQKISLPEQLVIVGNDDDALVCDNIRPRLSSVRIDHEGEGFAAARMLDRMMRRPNNPVKDVLLAPKGIAVRESTHPVSPAAGLIDRALLYIREHAADAITVDDVADHLNVSRRLLYLRFSKILGKSILAEITEQRIKMLKTKLKMPNVAIAKIARDCGFSTAGHANRVFKAATGMSMRNWRIKAQTGIGG